MSALITIDRSTLTVGFTKDVQTQKLAALMAAGDIEEVKDAEQQSKAVAVQQTLAEFRRMVEEQRKTLKAPFTAFGKSFDESVAKFVEKIIAEEERIASLNGEFQQLEIAKQKAAEATRLKELAENERLCQERLAKATSLDEHQAIREEHAQVAAQAPPLPPRPVEKGQVVKREIEFVVDDARALYLSFPNLVNLEPKRREIKEALQEGIKLPGVKWNMVVKSQTRGKANTELLI